MVNIKKFIDRVSVMDNSGNKDFVMSRTEARALRDEIVKIMLDKLDAKPDNKSDIIEVQISGGRW